VIIVLIAFSSSGDRLVSVNDLSSRSEAQRRSVPAVPESPAFLRHNRRSTTHGLACAMHAKWRSTSVICASVAGISGANLIADLVEDLQVALLKVRAVKAERCMCQRQSQLPR
jgi:hypothetical protein